MDTHLPYRHVASAPLAEDLRAALVNTLVFHVRDNDDWSPEPRRDALRAAYRYEVERVDRALVRLLDELGPPPDRGRVVLFTSDHGEAFFEHGDFEHGHALWQPVVHVPLVVSSPAAARGEVGVPVGHEDIVPTLLEVAGLPIPHGVTGIPLLARTPPKERPLVSQNLLYDQVFPASSYAVRSDSWKLVVHDRESLFDLRTDRFEAQDILSSQPETAGRLREARPTGGPAGDAVDQDEGAVDALRALGYVE